jgi:hypothetical protein
VLTSHGEGINLTWPGFGRSGAIRADQGRLFLDLIRSTRKQLHTLPVGPCWLLPYANVSPTRRRNGTAGIRQAAPTATRHDDRGGLVRGLRRIIWSTSGPWPPAKHGFGGTWRIGNNRSCDVSNRARPRLLGSHAIRLNTPFRYLDTGCHDTDSSEVHDLALL